MRSGQTAELRFHGGDVDGEVLVEVQREPVRAPVGGEERKAKGRFLVAARWFLARTWTRDGGGKWKDSSRSSAIDPGRTRAGTRR